MHLRYLESAHFMRRGIRDHDQSGYQEQTVFSIDTTLHVRLTVHCLAHACHHLLVKLVLASGQHPTHMQIWGIPPVAISPCALCRRLSSCCKLHSPLHSRKLSDAACPSQPLCPLPYLALCWICPPRGLPANEGRYRLV